MWTNFCVGNAIKYLWRAGLKGDALEDLKKSTMDGGSGNSKIGAERRLTTPQPEQWQPVQMFGDD